jgi:hypothetical protein
MHSINLEWKKFPVNLQAVETYLKKFDNYIGNSADTDLTIWFKEEPSEETKKTIAEYWEGIKEDLTYKSSQSLLEDQKSHLKSAVDKLAKLGLSAEEINSLRG